MPQQVIYEGTPQELAPYLAQHPDRRYRLIELGEENSTSSQERNSPLLDDKSRAALALLDAWIAEGESADEQTRLEADREVEEFKRNMNANRATLGERLVYP